jgi:capsular exopolysaccharide synthesis family protein
VGGGFASLCTAVVAEVLQPRICTPAEFQRVFNCPVLGRIPRFTREQLVLAGDAGLVNTAIPDSLPAEAYRALRTHLDLMRKSRRTQVVLLTSPTVSEGKSVTASNLASSIAQSGRHVLLVDADLRRPKLHSIHGRDRNLGLSDVLRGSELWESAVKPTSIERLDLVTSGASVANPSELLLGPALVDMLQSLRRSEYDLVIIDTPPLLAATDATILAANADGVLMVVRASDCRRDQGLQAIDMLRRADAELLGLVVNFARTIDRGTAVEGGISAYYYANIQQPGRLDVAAAGARNSESSGRAVNPFRGDPS